MSTRAPFTVVLFVLLSISVQGQSTASIEGSVTDQNGSLVAGAEIIARAGAIGLTRRSQSDDSGRFQLAALPVGDYRLEIRARGFQTLIVEGFRVEVGRILTHDFELQVGEASEQVSVSTADSLIELASVSVGHVIDRRTVQELPLNGRHFIDLGLLAPGSVTPPQSGNLSAPTRGQGMQAMNTGGNREDNVNYQVNGINFNDLINNIITLLPPVGSIQEFRLDNSTLSAEYGRNSGSVVNIATRSGTNDYHGELMEFFRNNALDARNFFDFNSSEAQPFKRNQFGVSVGGPLVLPRFGEGGSRAAYNGRDRTFFFFTYEGLRQRQVVNLNTVVLSEQQRLSVNDPVIRKLLDLIPRANFTDSSGASRFVGTTPAKVSVDQWSFDISHNLSTTGRLHAYYVAQRDDRNEPTLLGNNLPGFGDIRRNFKQIFTLNLTHVLSNATVNEARFGFNRFSFTGSARAGLNAADFQIMNGINQPIGLPQINVAGGFNFGGPRGISQRRGDTTFVASDTLSRLDGPHSIRLGAEYRRSYSNLSLTDPGLFNFPSLSSFIQDNANSFSITLPSVSSSLAQTALELFAFDAFKWKPNLTLSLGLRYALNVAPTERFDRMIVFDHESEALLRVGVHIGEVYESNVLNFQPRVGLAWDPFKDGKTSVRTAYAIMSEEPTLTAPFNTVSNPPLATPLSVTGQVRLDNALSIAAAGLAPTTVDHGYDNTYGQSWNLNVQREFVPQVVLMAGYFGAKGTHLRLARNLNQPVNGVRPITRLSASSPILPGASLGNITQIESSGNSSYNALWSSASARLSSRLQLNASYTWSKSIDYNSLNSPITVTVQNSYNLRGDRGLSDFDARHRFVLYGIYELPFAGNRAMEGWQVGAILQMQTGNPVNIITSNVTVNGVANTLRPDVTGGPVEIVGSVDRWFDTSRFVAVSRFGNLGRNVIIGPGFNNVDLSILKNTRLKEGVILQFRAEVFDLFNHPSFGQPGRVVGTPAFGRIVNTRFPTGDSGSSRQLQFALKLMF